MRKTLLILLITFLFISSITFAKLSDETIPSESSSTPPLAISPPCATDCSGVSNCSCGGVNIGAEVKYCSPDKVIYLTESDCELGAPSPPAGSEQEGEFVHTVTTPPETGLEILSNWQAIAALGIVISIILVAMGYAIGIGFEMPEMQAWASSELTQVFANVIIIIALLAIVGFIDLVIMTIVNGSGIESVHCVPGENCLSKTSNAYLDDYINTAKDGAKNVLDNNIDAAAWSNRRIGLYCLVIYCIQAGYTTTLVGEYMLDSDRYAIVFEYYQGILSSLYGQKFFINEISFKIGPLLLALGLVARSFYLTRKTGGLLMAIAAGIMFFFPAMYVFDWMTLDMTLNGDKSFQDQQSTCPEECISAIPLAYYYNSTASSYAMLNTTTQVYNMFDESQSDNAKDLIMGNVDSATAADGSTIVYTCNVNTSSIPDAQPTCDRSCRELPYPTSGFCANNSMQIACSAIPELCKISRIVKIIDETERAKCQQECRMIPPLKSDCNFGDCLKSRFDCRVAKTNNITWRPSIDPSLKGAEKCNDYPKDCPANLSASGSCTWVMPEFGSCKNLCSGCPEECRFDDPSALNSSTEPQCFDSGNFRDECKNCPSACKISGSSIQNVAPSDTAVCNSCPANHRIIPADEILPDGYVTDNPGYNCSLASCPMDFRVTMPRATCEECASVLEEYTYEPPMNFNCGELCKPTDSAPAKNAGEYTKIDENGLVGKEDIKTVSKLMIPGYLLPLFNITATIIVIMSLSAMLGGDVEIPGLGKIF